MKETWQLTFAAVALALTLGAATACSDDSEPADQAESTTAASAVTTSTVATTTSEPQSLEERIVANMQGSQIELLDFWPDGVNVAFFHHGDWSSEVTNWHSGPGDNCERATYTWSVEDAKSESEFTIHYDTLTEPADCADLGITRLTAVFTGSREVDGRLVYDFGYTAGLGTPDKPITGTRTVCSDQWDDPAPCDTAFPDFKMSTPPQEG